MSQNSKRAVIFISYLIGLLSIVWYKTHKMTYTDINKFYNVQLDTYTAELQETYKQLHADDETKKFLEWSTTRSSSFVLQLFYAVSAPLLNIFTTKTATNGILHRGEMFVLSKKQLLHMFDKEGKIGASVEDHLIEEPNYKNWLDLGAGDGGALERLGTRQLAEKVMTTEICGVMRKRLAWRGFEVKDTDNWDDQTYDVISMFNLLDRAGDPDKFLTKAHSSLSPEGKLVIAVVLPFRPYVERGGINNQPVIDVKPFQSSSRQHCDQLEAFVKAVQDRGFRLTSWSVVPYLCEGDQTTAYYTLRDTILIFDKT